MRKDEVIDAMVHDLEDHVQQIKELSENEDGDEFLDMAYYRMQGMRFYVEKMALLLHSYAHEMNKGDKQ